MWELPNRRLLSFAVWVPLLLLTGSHVAKADFITSINQLTVNGTVNWGVLGFNGASFGGPQYTVLSGIPNTSLTIAGPDQIAGGFRRVDQGLGWSGSFNSGEELIWSQVDGSFRIDFWNTQTGAPAPIAGFGARYEDSIGNNVFSGRLRGYDQFDNMLFNYELTGMSEYNGPSGSAPFFGAVSDQRNISYLYFDDLTTGAPLGQKGFALGTFYVQENPTMTPVPEPASILLFATSALGVVAFTRSRMASQDQPSPSV
jgi:hypothetical protein